MTSTLSACDDVLQFWQHTVSLGLYASTPA